VVAADSVASASAARPALLMLTVVDACGAAALAAGVLLAAVVEGAAGAGAVEAAAVAGGDADWVSGLTFIWLFSRVGKLR
jgi:hypothetical protein